MLLLRDAPFAQVVVPDHKDLDRGTLRAIIRQAGLGVDEFVELLSQQSLRGHGSDNGVSGNEHQASDQACA